MNIPPIPRRFPADIPPRGIFPYPTFHAAARPPIWGRRREMEVGKSESRKPLAPISRRRAEAVSGGRP